MGKITEEELIKKKVYKEILGMILDRKPLVEIQAELFEKIEEIEYKNINNNVEAI